MPAFADETIEPTQLRFSLTLAASDVLSPSDVAGSTGVAVGRPLGVGSLGLDDWDPRFTGYEDSTHLVVRKGMSRGRVRLDGALVVKVLALALDSNLDDGSYLRVAVDLDGSGRRKLSFTAFPFSSDRMRLGTSYRVSWGGSPLFFKPDPTLGPQSPGNTAIDPGLRMQYTDDRIAAWLGFKVSSNLDRNPMVVATRPIYAVLGSISVEAIPGLLRLEAQGGYFDRGTNPLFYAVESVPNGGTYVDHETTTLGGTFVVSLWQGIPPSLATDYALFRVDPTTAARYLAMPVYRPGFNWLLQSEATVITTSLQSSEDVTRDANQVAWATATSLRLQWGQSRLKLDAIARSVEFILVNAPSLVPYQAFPKNVSSSPDVFFSLGYDRHVPTAGLTVGATVGVDRPASVTETLVPGQGICPTSGGPTCTSGPVVVYTPGQFAPLPPSSTVDPLFVAKATVREDFFDRFSAFLDVYYAHDPSFVELAPPSSMGQPPQRSGTGAGTLGFWLTLQARL